MRVIINGIEKFPRFCGECFLMSGETCECSVPGVERTCNSYDGRYDDCPMRPLKAAGRLGDLDRIERTLHEWESVVWDRNALQMLRDCINLVKAAPTIIPADPAEEAK